MRIIKTNEKVLIWMHRNNITMQKVADNIGVTRQTWSKKMKDNIFTPLDLTTIQSMGFRDE